MANYTAIQKKKLYRKLKKINIISEKDIINIRVSELRKIKEYENFTINDLEIIWQLQDAINEKKLLDFFTDSE